MSIYKAPFISEQVTSGEYYYLNLTPPEGIAAAVICGGREQCSPAYRIERKRFLYHSIEFVSSGRGSITLSGKTYPLRPGAIYSYGPTVKHTIETDPEYPMLKHFVDFVGDELTDLVKATVLGENHPLYVSRPFRIRGILENLLQAGVAETRHRGELCVLLLKQLILYADETALPEQEAFSPAWQTYLRCRQHIERNFTELGSVAQVADECHVDKAYLSRLFGRYAEETPVQLLTRLKMARAAEMLSRQNLLIKEVAEATGYPDPYHFSRVFKRVYGIPPETFIRTTRRTT